MKKFLSVLLAVSSIAAILASCGADDNAEVPASAATETQTGDVAVEPVFESDENDPTAGYKPIIINNESFVVTAKDGFDNAGVSVYVCDTTADYAFRCDEDEATWSVYILDAPFEDAARYLGQAYTPDLVGNGILNIKKGRFVYIACDKNAFSCDEAPDTDLEIFFPGEISGTYSDSFSERAEATVIEKVEEDGENELYLKIHWSSSATEATIWEMECEKSADGKYRYDDCRKYTVTTEDNGVEDCKLIYKDGSGYFTPDNGNLLWNGAAEESCKNCVFVNSKA